MKTGAEPKKVIALVGLMAVAAIVYWTNSSSDAPVSSPARPAADPAAAVSQVSVPTKIARRDATGHANLGEFSPRLPDKIDPSKIDPTLRLDLLSKVQAIELEGGVRFIFQIGTPPPPPDSPGTKGPLPNAPPINVSGGPPATAPPAVIKDAPPPVVASAPQINLKYYGYSTKRSDGEKKAFFLDGEDIIVAAEGEIIKKQYKIVRIGVNSVQMEDTAHRSTQTIPLTPEAAPV